MTQPDGHSTSGADTPPDVEQKPALDDEAKPEAVPAASAPDPGEALEAASSAVDDVGGVHDLDALDDLASLLADIESLPTDDEHGSAPAPAVRDASPDVTEAIVSALTRLDEPAPATRVTAAMPPQGPAIAPEPSATMAAETATASGVARTIVPPATSAGGDDTRIAAAGAADQAASPEPSPDLGPEPSPGTGGGIDAGATAEPAPEIERAATSDATPESPSAETPVLDVTAMMEEAATPEAGSDPVAADVNAALQEAGAVAGAAAAADDAGVAPVVPPTDGAGPVAIDDVLSADAPAEQTMDLDALYAPPPATAAAPLEASASAPADPSPDAGGPEASSVPTDAGSALRDVDDALADDVETLLNANFETVSEVLDDVFEEHAVIVQKAVHDGAPVAAPAEIRRAKPVTPAPSAPSDAVVDTQAEPPRRADISALLPPEPSASAPESDAGSQIIPERAGTAPVPPGPVEEPAPTGAPDDAAPGEAPTVVVPVPPSAEPFAEPVEPAWLRWFAVIEPRLVAVLRTLNIPLRHLPPKARPVVEWIALSLAFWVPIVWVVALFVVGY